MIRSRLVAFARRVSSLMCSARAAVRRIDPALSIGSGTKLSRGVMLTATDGGRIIIGRNVWIGRNVRLLAKVGQIRIADNSYIGDGSWIVAHESVTIGENVLIAEYVVIRDQEHVVALQGPKRLAGVKAIPIRIGDDVWIGAKASVLMGSNIGPGSVIGAHALVRGAIPAFSVAVGIPAKVIKTVDRIEQRP